MTLYPRLVELQAEMTEWRRDFHAHPEIGFEEHRTRAVSDLRDSRGFPDAGPI
jgi:metal-dependent amidase/aminoacylase/carboxypeptidase family protein